MNINICTIDRNCEPGRQTIYWNSYNGIIYTTVDPYDPSDLICESLEDATDLAYALWSRDWHFEWCEYAIKPEYLDKWGAVEGETVNAGYIAAIARGWDIDPVDIMDQLEEVEA